MEHPRKAPVGHVTVVAVPRVFHDEFETSSLNRDSWDTDDPWDKVHNNELQAYVDTAFKLVDGILRIRADNQPAVFHGKPMQFTSGIIHSYGKHAQKFGWFEIRCRIPKGKGLWPAFWLLPQAGGWPPEIDVFEILGSNTGIIFFTNHWRT